MIGDSVPHRPGSPGAAPCKRLVVPVGPDADADRTVAEACLLAADGGLVVAVVAIEVPLGVPLEAPLPAAVCELTRELLARARSIGRTYGVDVQTRTLRVRDAAEAILEEAARQRADAIVVRMGRGERLDRTTELMLRRAPCRVLVAVT